MAALLQTATGDIDLTANNFTVVTDLATVVRQKAKDVLTLFQGEWFLDASDGTPWFQLILGIKNPDFSAIKSAIKSRLQGVTGVSTVQDVLFNWDPKKRLLTYSVNLVLSNGLTIAIEPPPPTP